MQGILFLHDQAGLAIKNLQEEVDTLTARIAELEAELLDQAEPTGD